MEGSGLLCTKKGISAVEHEQAMQFSLYLRHLDFLSCVQVDILA